MIHPSLSLRTHDGNPQGKTFLYITGASGSKKDYFSQLLLSSRLRMSNFFFFFSFLMLARVDGQRRSVLFIFFLTLGPATAQSADKHALNSRNQSGLGRRYRARWQLSPRWGSSVTTCAIVTPPHHHHNIRPTNRPPVIFRTPFLFRAAEILGGTLSVPCR